MKCCAAKTSNDLSCMVNLLYKNVFHMKMRNGFRKKKKKFENQNAETLFRALQIFKFKIEGLTNKWGVFLPKCPFLFRVHPKYDVVLIHNEKCYIFQGKLFKQVLIKLNAVLLCIMVSWKKVQFKMRYLTNRFLILYLLLKMAKNKYHVRNFGLNGKAWCS